MSKQKDIICLISNNFQTKNGDLIGARVVDNGADTFILTKTRSPDNLSSQQCFGKVEENNIKLFTSASQQQTINLNESLPIEPKDKTPLVTSLSFDYDIYQESVLLNSTKTENKGNCLELLHTLLQRTKYQTKHYNFYNILLGAMHLQYLLFTSCNIYNFLKKSYWYTYFDSNLKGLFQTQKFKIRNRNWYSGKLLDFILGLISLYFILKYKPDIWNSILQTTKYVIDELKNLLDILMGSPAGLKLNSALNHSLGLFFFYHIALWKKFIESICTGSSCILYGFIALGSFGLSYQIALCADIIMFLTFHVYCIYVYAARLFRVQTYVITSLWRLFIGRKYNPLKDRVDSFQYSHNQLFIGTLGFTVLLFLLPTILLYYVVFAMFRIAVLLVCKLMIRIATSLSSIPLYLLWLRLIGSSKIKGTIRIYATKNVKDCTLQLHSTLDLLDSWFSEGDLCVNNDKSGKTFNEYVSCLFTGKLI